MAPITKLHGGINEYRLHLFPNNSNLKARIDLRVTHGFSFRILFLGDTVPMPSPQYDTAEKSLETYERFSTYPAYVDMLRNEKPLVYYFDRVTKEFHISSDVEDVGEQERPKPRKRSPRRR